MIRVLVVEDSPTSMQLMVHMLKSDPDIAVVGQAISGRQGVALANQLRPDLITMDVVMDDMNGLEATIRIMAENPTPIIIVTAHADSRELNVAFEALQAGALDVIAKPDNFGSKDVGDWQDDLLAKVKKLAGIDPRPLRPRNRDS
jgi:two-component system, chemotaxis family, protein-glutamate methylesterase/glutaminase